MENQAEKKYSFCPKCGTLMENGICPECTAHLEQGVYSSRMQAAQQVQREQQEKTQMQQSTQQPPQMQYQPYVQENSQQNFGQTYRQPYQQQYGGYGQMQPPQKKYNGWVIAGIATAVFILFLCVAGSFFYGYFLVHVADRVSQTDSLFGRAASDESQDEGIWEEEQTEPYEEEQEYVPSPDDEYYYELTNYINTDVPYSLVSKSYVNGEENEAVDIIISYYELKGEDIPNLESLNDALETAALYYAEEFPKGSYYAEYGSRYAAYITSYVTYNDEDIVSIVMDEYVMADEEYHVDLYAINIDLKNGVILDNNSLLKIDESFAEDFCRRSDDQNGETFVDSLSTEQVMQALQNKQSAITYYTPLGMEIGLNYVNGGTSGWVTATYKDYEKYLSKF